MAKNTILVIIGIVALIALVTYVDFGAQSAADLYGCPEHFETSAPIATMIMEECRINKGISCKIVDFDIVECEQVPMLCMDADESNAFQKNTAQILEQGKIIERKTDFCIGDTLTEYICVTLFDIGTETVDCGFGCSNGACLGSPSEPTGQSRFICFNTDNSGCGSFSAKTHCSGKIIYKTLPECQSALNLLQEQQRLTEEKDEQTASAQPGKLKNGEECVSSNLNAFGVRISGPSEECESGYCKVSFFGKDVCADAPVETITQPTETSTVLDCSKICLKSRGEQCVPPNYLAIRDNSGPSTECATGWCKDTPGVFGVCADVPSGMDPAPACVECGTAKKGFDINETIFNVFGFDITILHLIIGFFVLMMFFVLMRN